MGFLSVYRSLVEIFPQIDARILKAIALEHSKDVQSAIDFILLEELSSKDWNPSNDSKESKSLKTGQDEFQGKHESFPKSIVVKSDVSFSSSSSESAVSNNAVIHDDALHVSLLNDDLYLSSKTNPYDPNDNTHDQVQRNAVSKDLQKCCVSEELFENSCTPVAMGSCSSLNVLCTAFSEVKNTEGFPLNEILMEEDISQTNFSPKKLAPEIQVCCVQRESCCSHNSHDFSGTFVEEQCCSIESSSNVSRTDLPYSSEVGIETQQINVDIAHKDASSSVEDVAATISTIVGSEQICRVNFLEDMIEDSKNIKKTLLSAVESVVNLMKEVDAEEKAIENAREICSKADADILQRVEDMKQMLHHAREANNMHAGEVHGEKSILGTEAKELQSRLFGLSDERDKSLAILDDMREALERRLAAAEEEKKACLEEKAGKEESARAALAEQELAMEKVAGESKSLHQQAEENSKLRGFLMDRGRVVDILQGEIGVICKDVALLKEKFDERVPLSKSVSSSQTSCILATSTPSNPIIVDDGWDFLEKDSS